MPSKRNHHKSRLGCRECKSRRIKCDEIGPVCGPCTKKGIECEYRQLHPFQTQIQVLTASNFREPQQKRDSVVASSSTTPNSNYDPKREHDTEPTFSSADMLLMHHYTISTSLTIGMLDTAEYHSIWQERVPQLSGQHSFLLHAILSLAAAHSSNMDACRQHYSKAITTFTAFSQDSLAQGHVEAVYCYCILMMLIHSALECCGKSLGDDLLTSLADLCGMVRTGASMLATVEPEVRQQKIGVLMRHMSTLSMTDMPEELSHSLRCMDTTISAQSASSEPWKLAALQDAMFKLRLFYNFVNPRPANWIRLIQWPITLPPDFLTMLHGMDPAALAIFAHWCVPLHHAPRKWYVDDWPKQAILVISEKLVGTAWQACVEWPLSQV